MQHQPPFPPPPPAPAPGLIINPHDAGSSVDPPNYHAQQPASRSSVRRLRLSSGDQINAGRLWCRARVWKSRVSVSFIAFRWGLFVHLFSILGAGDRAWSNFTHYEVDSWRQCIYASAMNINNAVLVFMILIIKHLILISMQNFIHNFPLLKKQSH